MSGEAPRSHSVGRLATLIAPAIVEAPRGADPGDVVRAYSGIEDPVELVDRVLADAGFNAPFRNRRDDARLAGARLREHLLAVGGSGRLERAEVVRRPFFRRKGAYL